jgi:hypothetical protein
MFVSQRGRHPSGNAENGNWFPDASDRSHLIFLATLKVTCNAELEKLHRERHADSIELQSQSHDLNGSMFTALLREGMFEE